jgi:hypothetical protein
MIYITVSGLGNSGAGSQHPNRIVLTWNPVPCTLGPRAFILFYFTFFLVFFLFSLPNLFLLPNVFTPYSCRIND